MRLPIIVVSAAELAQALFNRSLNGNWIVYVLTQVGYYVGQVSRHVVGSSAYNSAQAQNATMSLYHIRHVYDHLSRLCFLLLGFYLAQCLQMILKKNRKINMLSKFYFILNILHYNQILVNVNKV
jgi:hypothetical protein